MKSAGTTRVTLDEFVNNGSQWPRGARGFRVVGRGRVVWETADYPDGSEGNNVRVSRIVTEGGETFSRVSFYDRDTPIEFVFDDPENIGAVEIAMARLDHGLVELRALRVMFRREYSLEALLQMVDDARLRARAAVEILDGIECRLRANAKEES